MSDVCPLCGKGSDINWTGDYAYQCCNECKVRWTPNPVFTGSHYKEVRGCKRSQKIMTRLSTYRTADEIYKQSTLNNVFYDSLIREILDELEREWQKEEKRLSTLIERSDEYDF
jgi:hypothetical protein